MEPSSSNVQRQQKLEKQVSKFSSPFRCQGFKYGVDSVLQATLTAS